MNNFNSFILNKHIDRLAEKCVKENIPIVEFTQWYEEEGQYLKEGFWGDVGSGAAKGAGVGALAGGLPGAGWGAAAGGLYGAGKSLYNTFRGNAGVSSVVDAKKQAIAALTKLSQLSGTHNLGALTQMINNIKGISPKPDATPAGTPAPEVPTPAGTPTPTKSWRDSEVTHKGSSPYGDAWM
jgi:hypothetical protein